MAHRKNAKRVRHIEITMYVIIKYPIIFFNYPKLWHIAVLYFMIKHFVMLNNMYLRHLIIHIASIIFSRGSSLNTFFSSICVSECK